MTTKWGITLTRGVNDRVAENNTFSKAVWSAIMRFSKGDWGNVVKEDKAKNHHDIRALNRGEYGFVLGSYDDYDDCPKFWIIRDTETTTVLFPSEY